MVTITHHSLDQEPSPAKTVSRGDCAMIPTRQASKPASDTGRVVVTTQFVSCEADPHSLTVGASELTPRDVSNMQTLIICLDI